MNDARPRRDFRRFDWGIVAVLLALTALSILFLWSAGYDASTGAYRPFWKKQLGWAVVGAALLLLMTRVSYRALVDHAYLLYWAGIALLLLVMVGGVTLNNAKRWIDLRFMLLQPSELMKVVLVVTLARYIRWRDDYKKLRGLVLPFAITLLPAALILKQPDLGTALLFVPVLFGMLFVAGARARHLGLVLLMGLACLPVLFFGFLKEYQQKRILVFLGQARMDENMRRNEGYHLDRSRIAVGSGGLTGRGLGRGDQRVPENETDFIFTVVAEEWGFLGSALVLALYAALFAQLVASALVVKEPSGKLLIVGILILLLTQTCVNLGMTVGLAPITGLTLPFLSYGGSSLLSLVVAIGLVLNVKLHPDYAFTRDFD